jgi:hypothetical protein
MLLWSDRTATKVADSTASKTQIKTIKDFLKVVKSGDVRRVEIDDMSTYRSRRLGGGSQSTVYDDQGIRHHGLPAAVIKCALFQLSNETILPTTEDRRVSPLQAN